MSVEQNQTEDTARLSQSQTSSDGPQGDTPCDSITALSESKSDGQSYDTTMVDHEPNMSGRPAIRTWFEGLSSDERAAALSFKDDDFLSMFLAMAIRNTSSSSTSTTANRGTIGTRNIITPERQGVRLETEIDWTAMVSLRDILRMLGIPLAAAVVKTKDAPAEDEKEQGTTEEAASAATPENVVLDSPGDSDAFRIPSENASSAKAAQSTKPLKKELGKSPQMFLDHVCTLFPSLLKHVSGEIDGDDHHPFVTINPVYLENTSSEELILLLDAMGQEASKAPFLSKAKTNNATIGREEKQSEEKTAENDTQFWLDSLLANESGTHSEDSQSSEVPLYALLIARMEFAVFESYQKSKGRLQMFSEANKDESTAYPKEGEGSVKSSSSQPKYVTAALIGDVRNCLRLLKEGRPSSDQGLDEIMQPVVDAFLGGTPSVLCSAESLLFTPLSWLALSSKTGSGIDFASLDAAILSALHQATSGTRPSKGSKDSSTVAPPEESGAGPESVNGQGKKKKKRKNRRKNRKNSNADSVGQSENERMVSELSTPSKAKQEANTVPSSLSLSKSSATEKSSLPDRKDTGIRLAPSDISSVKSESSSDDNHSEPLQKDTNNGEITVSRVEGVMVIATPPPVIISPDGGGKEGSSQAAEGDDDDGDAWETVEVRPRGQRKKGIQSGNRNIQRSSSSYSNTGSQPDSQSTAKKSKGSRSAASRKKNAKKTSSTKEAAVPAIDKGEDGAKKKVPEVARKPATNPWNIGPPVAAPANNNRLAAAAKEPAANPAKREATLRDIVLGRHVTDKQAGEATPSSGKALASRNSEVRTADSKSEASSPSKSNSSSRPKTSSASGADQNTAPTYQETVSAVSNFASLLKGSPGSGSGKESKSDSSSVDTDEAPQNRGRAKADRDRETSSLVPPLPTLLSPENANSANSSVASSLEVPHSSRLHHHHKSAIDTNDVGYHLLDVCERLSQDMSLFMSRRALALNSRRRERGALLVALQDTVASIWPGRGHVETYGSCATQLDLPSSDLDVLIIGVDRNPNALVNTPPPPSMNRSQSMSVAKAVAGEISAAAQPTQAPERQLSLPAYNPLAPANVNSERVVRLAKQLERQPWAVQVNAIPTASVPVVKVLADPSKLSGASTGGEWMVHHQHLAAQAAAAAGQSVDTQDHMQYHPPWRGADVMNGLLKLDITFEGPEHGGIGSTHFSANVVSEASKDTGIHPDATPLVQVVMVLKEMLAQRKLNEPYSGGLGSYALLLLVVSLLQERAVIREEIERAERQRKAMVTADGNCFGTTSKPDRVSNGASDSASSKKSAWSSPPRKIIESKQGTAPKKTAMAQSPEPKQTPPAQVVPSSWASIAKKNGSTKNAAKEEKADVKKASPEQNPHKSSNKPTSFAEAVARSSATQAPNQPGNKVVDNRGSPKKGSQPSEDDSSKSAGLKTPAKGAVGSSSATLSEGDSLVGTPPSLCPQGFNDVIEVLCSGETTAGKLLMHFLLYYGQHFDAQSTAIDISGKHERGHARQPYFYFSPYIQRRAPGTIDPVTGMLTVDPVVIYDPLEGAENHNVARRCFAWNQVRWVFGQAYNTLSSAVERSATPPTTPSGNKAGSAMNGEDGASNAAVSNGHGPDAADLDPSSPLLKCLLSF